MTESIIPAFAPWLIAFGLVTVFWLVAALLALWGK